MAGRLCATAEGVRGRAGKPEGLPGRLVYTAAAGSMAAATEEAAMAERAAARAAAAAMAV